MADTNYTIGTGGGADYSTVQSWEDDESSGPPADMSGQGIHTAQCQAEEVAGGVQTYIGGRSNLGATDYLAVESLTDSEHDGRAHEVSGAGNARLEYTGAADMVRIGDEYFRIRWMELKGPGNNNYDCMQVTGVGTCTTHIHHNIIHNNQANADTDQDGIYHGDSSCQFFDYRNIIYGTGAHGIRGRYNDTGTGIYNNTIYECNYSDSGSDYGIYFSDADVTAKNNVALNSGNADLSFNLGTYDNNASSDSSGDDDLDDLTPSNELINPTTTWGDCDLLIKSGATLIAAGTDLSGLTGTFPEIDISIDDRGGSSVSNWDVGASEYISSGLSINVSETINAVESIGPDMPLAGISKFEQITLEEFRQLLISFTPEKFENITISEFLNIMLGISPNIFENINITELIQAAMQLADIDKSETINLTEYINAQIESLGDLEASGQDLINIIENIQIAMQLAGIDKNETINITESVIAQLPLSLSVYDLINISEYIMLDIPLEINRFENITIQEFRDLLINIAPIVFEDLTIAEFVQLLMGDFSISIDENINLTEIIQAAINLAGIDINDMVNLTEYINTQMESIEDRAVSISQIINLIENVQMKLQLAGIEKAETINISESVLLQLPIRPAVQDVINIVEYIAIQIPLLTSVADVINITENILCLLNPLLFTTHETVQINEWVNVLVTGIVGKITAAFSGRKPQAAFSGKKPAITYTGRKPGITFQ